MKILPLWFLFFAIGISLMLFTMTSYDCSGNGGDYNDTGNECFNSNGEYVNYSTDNESFGNNDMWDSMFNPWKGGDSKLMLMLISFGLLIGAVGFNPFTNRSDISLLSLPFLFMLVAPMPLLVSLYSFIFSQTSSIACAVNTSCFPGQLAAVIVCGPLLFAWASACLEWVSGRPFG